MHLLVLLLALTVPPLVGFAIVLWERRGRQTPTVWLVRHQAAGVLSSYVFQGRPTEAQIEGLRAVCDRAHGPAHPKTPDEPYWLVPVETVLLGSGALKRLGAIVPGTENISRLGQISSSGTGNYSRVE